MSGKWGQTRYRLTEEIACERYGKGNYERIDSSLQVRTNNHSGQSASPLISMPTNPAER